MPRKSKITPDVVERIAGALAAGADWTVAAAIIGYTAEGLRVHGKKHPADRAKWDEARQRADGMIVKSLYDKARAGDTTAMIFWLKNRQPIEWRDRREIVGDPKAPITLLWLDEPDSPDGET